MSNKWISRRQTPTRRCRNRGRVSITGKFDLSLRGVMDRSVSPTALVIFDFTYPSAYGELVSHLPALQGKRLRTVRAKASEEVSGSY